MRRGPESRTKHLKRTDVPLPGELPPKSRRNKKKDSGKRGSVKPVYRAIAVLLACAVGMVLWVNRENLRPENISEWFQTKLMGLGTGSGYPMHFSNESVLPRNFISEDKNIFFTSDTAVQAYNGSAKQLFSHKHSLSSPVMKVNGNRVLTYSLGGTNYRVDNQLKTLVSEKADGKIMGGAVCSNGRFALITQEAGYCGRLTAYMPSGQVAFKYSFSEYYPTAVALNYSGDCAAVAAVSASGGALQSAVYKLNLSSGSTAKPTAVCKDTTFVDVGFTEKDGVLAVGDTRTEAVDASGNVLNTYSYGDGELTAWSLQGGTAALGISKFHDSAEGSLTVVGADGKPLSSVQLKGEAKSISRSGSAVSVLNKEKVQVFGLDGSAKGTAAVSVSARAAALKSENEVYVLNVSGVELKKIT